MLVAGVYCVAFMMVISLALILLCVFEWEADETCLFLS